MPSPGSICLVNNAGVRRPCVPIFLEATEESFDRLVSVNVKGPYFLTQIAARWMIEQAGAHSTAFEGPEAANRRQGRTALARIVRRSSLSPLSALTQPGQSRRLLRFQSRFSMLTPLFAARLAEYGINVYEIRPGIIATDMTGPVKAKYDKLIADGLTPIARWGTRRMSARRRRHRPDWLPFSTGEVINVDGGFHVRRL